MCKCRPIYELIEAPYDLRKSDRKILDYRSDGPFTRPHKQFLVAFLVQDIHLDNVFFFFAKKVATNVTNKVL